MNGLTRYTRYLTGILLMLLSVDGYSQSGSVSGTISDYGSGDEMPFVNVSLFKDSIRLTAAVTDFDGKFILKQIPADTYNLRISYVGYKTHTIDTLVIVSDRTLTLELRLSSEASLIFVPRYKNELNPEFAETNLKSIEKRPFLFLEKSSNGISGANSTNRRTRTLCGSSRSGSSIFFNDGLKIIGSGNLPKSVDNLQPFTKSIRGISSVDENAEKVLIIKIIGMDYMF